ncbi:unnamed protein product [Lupinus luteus]|uniref:MATH domain-containing protein n=1 Tax=Lupinus luteus TaxID=3873 RepID=A0AAV1VRK7_LUPLU
MENQQRSDETAETFTWTIKSFSKLRNKLYSEIFFIGGHPWRLFIFPKGNNVDYLSIYLDAGDSANLPYGWSRLAKFKLSLINKVNSKMTKTKETEHEFNARESDWGFTSFIPLNEIWDTRKGFIVDDTCIIEAEIFVTKREHENQVDQAAKSATVAPVSTQVNVVSDNPSSKETSSIALGELVDFRGLGKIEKAFIPLLEEVCLRYPSLIESQQKRSRKFFEWAFTALGRVLHFLKTKKVKDMNDVLFVHLQDLWEELETFKFDLTWLEPHVQSALGMKNYMEKAVEVKKMKENVAVREMEIKRLKAKMASAEIDLEIAKRDLVKAEEGFKELDLDRELGYKA